MTSYHEKANECLFLKVYFFGKYFFINLFQTVNFVGMPVTPFCIPITFHFLVTAHPLVEEIAGFSYDSLRDRGFLRGARFSPLSASANSLRALRKWLQI